VTVIDNNFIIKQAINHFSKGHWR